MSDDEGLLSGAWLEDADGEKEELAAGLARSLEAASQLLDIFQEDDQVQEVPPTPPNIIEKVMVNANTQDIEMIDLDVPSHIIIRTR